ncbi:MAG: hypothetical protein AMXMBFR47_08250 [Planctomycetota bacterium]
MTTIERRIIGHIIAGSRVCNAIMPRGHPAPIELPIDADELERLIGAHGGGFSATVTTSIANRAPKRVRVSPTLLAAFCPAADGLCRWVAADLDGTSHGPGGLADPVRAARAIVQAGREHGLDVLAVRSGSGSGVHIWCLLGEPSPLADGVLGIAALVASGLLFDRDGFACGDGRPATLGAAGCVELIPKSTTRPRLGWPLTLPFGGAARAPGGGQAFDPMTGEPRELADVPLTEPAAWRRLVAKARTRIPKLRPRRASREFRPRELSEALASLDGQTREFLDGRTGEGGRNRAAFAAACSLLGRGVAERDAERLILDGAAACGLPAREARTVLASAVGAIRAKRGQR